MRVFQRGESSQLFNEFEHDVPPIENAPNRSPVTVVPGGLGTEATAPASVPDAVTLIPEVDVAAPEMVPVTDVSFTWSNIWSESPAPAGTTVARSP